MFSIINSSSNSFKFVCHFGVKYAHRSSARFVKRNPLDVEEKDELRKQMLEDAEAVEDFHDWIEDKVQNPKFTEKLFSEEEKLKSRIKFKIIKQKYFKKSPEINLLTWDAKEQIRFLHNEYPDEWTVDHLAESFPVSRNGILKLLKSCFHPKSLMDVIKHDKRVQKNWKELKEGKKKGLLDHGPIISRYEALLRNAAGSSSLPMPNLNRLLLDSERKFTRDEEKPGKFLSIVKDYCNRKATKMTESKSKTVISSTEQAGTNSQLGEHISRNRMLVNSLINETNHAKTPISIKPFPKTLTSPGYNQLIEMRSDFIENSFRKRDYDESKSSKQLIDMDFDLNDLTNDHEDGELNNLCQRHSHQLQRQTTNVKISRAFQNLHRDHLISNANPQGTKKQSSSEKESTKMEENPQSTLKPMQSPYVIETKTKAVLRDIEAGGEEDGEMYTYSTEKGYQYLFGRRKDLPQRRISIPQKDNSTRKKVYFMKNGNCYDDDGEFLYRAP